MSDDKLIEVRRDYVSDNLRRQHLVDSPVEQFKHWLQNARDQKLIDATAMALSTIDTTGQPHSRMVLLKNVDEHGFTFYTNYDSDKGQDLAQNPKACLLFYWRELERQVRIEGVVTKIDSDEADTYFHSRPEGSRFSAAASEQSRLVSDRLVLENRVAELKQQHPDGQIPRPVNWGGYLLSPQRYEFWQGRADRLHDRFQYLRTADAQWRVDRMSP